MFAGLEYWNCRMYSYTYRGCCSWLVPRVVDGCDDGVAAYGGVLALALMGCALYPWYPPGTVLLVSNQNQIWLYRTRDLSCCTVRCWLGD